MEQRQLLTRYYLAVGLVFFICALAGIMVTNKSWASDSTISHMLQQMTSSGNNSSFYAQRGYQPAWVNQSGFSQQGQQMMDMIQSLTANNPSAQASWQQFGQQVQAGNASPGQLAQVDRILTEHLLQLMQNPSHAQNLDLQQIEGLMHQFANAGDIQQIAQKALHAMDGQSTSQWMQKIQQWGRQILTKFQASMQ